MQTEQIPLTLLGVKPFTYTSSDYSKVIYNPLKQTSNSLAFSGNRETVSDLGTDSGLILQSQDDEERGVDD